MDRQIRSKMQLKIFEFRNAGKLERPPIERASLVVLASFIGESNLVFPWISKLSSLFIL